MHSLVLRPADSLRCPWQLSSMGFRASVSLLSAIQATRLRSFASVGFSPLNALTFAGRADQTNTELQTDTPQNSRRRSWRPHAPK